MDSRGIGRAGIARNLRRLVVAVLIAASAAYSTPVSTPVVTLVVDPGRYRFVDFVKVGVPMLFLTYLATLAVVPLVFPFD
jgi:di/tricarboxylate transporter